MAGPRQSLTILRCSDLEASLKFFRDGLGLPLHEGSKNAGFEGDEFLDGRHFALSWKDGAYLHFALYQAGKRGPTRGGELGFNLTGLDQVHARVSGLGFRVVHPPRPEPWGRTARYEDPDGNVISVSER